MDVILEAFALRQGRSARGDADHRRLRQRGSRGSRRLALGGASAFVGRGRAGGDAARCCDDADIFLNASVVDNQPVSILEAFAAGLPVVSTPTGDIAAMVRHGETGLLVPPLDPTRWPRPCWRCCAIPDAARDGAARAAKR